MKLLRSISNEAAGATLAIVLFLEVVLFGEESIRMERHSEEFYLHAYTAVARHVLSWRCV